MAIVHITPDKVHITISMRQTGDPLEFTGLQVYTQIYSIQFTVS